MMNSFVRLLLSVLLWQCTVYAQDLTLLGAGRGSIGAATIPADLFMDFETSTDGTAVTTVIASDATHTSASPTWTVSASMTSFVVSTTSSLGTMLSTFTVDGTNYDGSGGTRGWARNHPAAGPQLTQAAITTNSSKVSVGAWWRTGLGTTASFVLFDWYEIDANSGTEYCVLQANDDNNNSTFKVLAHASSSNGGDITVSSNTIYWMTLQMDTGAGTCELEVYNSTGGLVGSSSGTVATGNNINRFILHPTQHGGTAATGTGVDNLVIDWTN